MKKLGLGAVALLVIVLFAGRWYYVSQIEKQLDQTASTIGQFGGRLSYRDVNISLGGTVSVEGLRLSVPGAGSDLRVDQIALHTGGPLGVHSLASSVKRKVLPENLSLSFEGMVMPVTTGNTAAMHPFGVPGMGRHLAAGCGERDNFTPVDYVDMGYADPIFDVHLEYRVQGGGELVEFDIHSQAPELHRSEMSAEFSLGAPSLAFAHIAQASAQMRLLGAELHYRDLGFYKKLLAFCQSETGLSRTALIDRHLDLWREAWKWFGLKPGAVLEQAYKSFLQKPEQMTLEINPTQRVSAASLTRVAPEQLIYRLQTDIAVNGKTHGSVDLAPLTEEEALAWREERRREAQAQQAERNPEQAPPPKPQPIPRDEWAQHSDVDVVLVQSDGTRLTGTIESLEEKVMQFKIVSHGGFVIRPFEYGTIQALYLPSASEVK